MLSTSAGEKAFNSRLAWSRSTPSGPAATRAGRPAQARAVPRPGARHPASPAPSASQPRTRIPSHDRPDALSTAPSWPKRSQTATVPLRPGTAATMMRRGPSLRACGAEFLRHPDDPGQVPDQAAAALRARRRVCRRGRGAASRRTDGLHRRRSRMGGEPAAGRDAGGAAGARRPDCGGLERARHSEGRCRGEGGPAAEPAENRLPRLTPAATI